MKALHFIFILAILFFTSCKKKDDTPQPQAQSISGSGDSSLYSLKFYQSPSAYTNWTYSVKCNEKFVIFQDGERIPDTASFESGSYIYQQTITGGDSLSCRIKHGNVVTVSGNPSYAELFAYTNKKYDSTAQMVHSFSNTFTSR